MNLSELMIEIQPYLINIAITVLTALASYIGLKIKSRYEEKTNTETKRKVVESTCRYINQLYYDLDGPEKLEKAKEYIIEQLEEKDISITQLELDILIESTVNSFKEALNDE